MDWVKVLSQLLIYAFCMVCFLKCSEPDETDKFTLVRDQQDNLTYRSIFFVDENIGWVAGDSGVVYQSVNGGESWTKQSTNVSSNLWSISFIDHNTGWVCGTEGTLLKTTNGGLDWETCLSGSAEDGIYLSVHFFDSETGWISNNNGSLLRTDNGGDTWELKIKHSRGGMDVSRFDPDIQFHMHGRLYRTFDGGTSWDTIMVDFPEHYFALNPVVFIDRNYGYLPLQNASGWVTLEKYPLLITKDGGITWTESEYLDAIWPGLTVTDFVSPEKGWVAESHKIYGTTDGGYTWEMVYEASAGTIRELFFLDENHGWVLDFNGRIYNYK